MRLSCDSLATQTLKYASVGTLLRRLKLPSCVGLEESAGRLTRDSCMEAWSWEWNCRYHRERLSPWLAPSYQEILFSYFWKNGDSYIACVLLIVYGHYLCISIYFWLIELRINLQLVSFVNYAISRSISHKWNSISSKGKFNFTFLKINSKYSWNSWVAKLPNSEQLFCYKLYPKILINIIFYSWSFLINNNIKIYIYTHTYIYIYLDTGIKHERQYYNFNLYYLSKFGYSINFTLILHAFISICI